MVKFEEIKKKELNCFAGASLINYDFSKNPVLVKEIKSLLNDISSLLDENKKKIKTSPSAKEKAGLELQNRPLLGWRESWLNLKKFRPFLEKFAYQN